MQNAQGNSGVKRELVKASTPLQMVLHLFVAYKH